MLYAYETIYISFWQSRPFASAAFRLCRRYFCLSSCEDDLERDKTSTSISFTPEIQAGWDPLARSMTGTDMPRGSVSPLQGGRTPLYLHTLYTDSIAVSSFSKGKDAAVRMTRAARVSAENMYDHFGVSAYAYTGTGTRAGRHPTISTTPQPASPAATIHYLPPIIGRELPTR